MKNLATAIYSRATSGATLMGLVGSRFYEDEAVEGTQYPYIVYSIIDSPKDRTFTEIFRNTTVQFSIYSTSKSTTEVKDIYAELSSRFDECDLTITGSRLLWFREQNVLFTTEELATHSGTIVRGCHVDFEVRTSLN